MTFSRAIYPRNPQLPVAVLRPFAPLVVTIIAAIDDRIQQSICGVITGHGLFNDHGVIRCDHCSHIQGPAA